MTSYCHLLLIEDFGEAMGLKRPRLIPFWCLMPKGEKIKAKAINGSATTCEISKRVELELFDLSKYSYLQNLVSCVENL